MGRHKRPPGYEWPKTRKAVELAVNATAVAGLYNQGRTTTQIVAALHVSRHFVHNHRLGGKIVPRKRRQPTASTYLMNKNQKQQALRHVTGATSYKNHDGMGKA